MTEQEPFYDLAAAAAEAVTRSRKEAEHLLMDVDLLGLELHASAERLAQWEILPGDPIAQYRKVVDQLTAGATRDFDQQLDGMETFNIVLFGRTGAGKSSLISAMARLDGSRVSQGESDWTVEAAEVAWRGVKLFDTPGINGWGRLESREVLEQRARDEVKKADVVLLCFDNQSQQAAEFQKVARWVKDFDKPVVAVLNNRNPFWGMAGKVPSEKARRSLSQTVRQHVSNIEDNLEAVDLHRIPVIVLSARRALDSRATEPFQGPDSRGRGQRLERYGSEQLLESSNLLALEGLLSAMVSTGSVELRLASLREGARSIYTNTEVECDRVHREAVAACSIIESTIATALGVLGYPEAEQRRTRFKDARIYRDLLTELEFLRGEPFSERVQGSLQYQIESLLSAHLKGLETASIAAAEEAVKDAFRVGQTLGQEEFIRRVFDQSKIDEAAATVQRDAADFAGAKLNLIAQDGIADAAFTARAISVDGDSGRGWRNIHTATRVASLAAGVTTVLAAVNSWNPVGWGAAAASMVLGIFARRAAKKAEDARLKARSSSIAAARLSVREAYRELRTDLAQQISESIWDRATANLTSQLQAAVGLRLLAADVAGLHASVTRQREAIPPKPDVASVVERGVAVVLRERGRASAADILWGERWVGESATQSIAVPATPDAAAEPHVDLGEVLAGAMPSARLADAEEWVERMRRRDDLPAVESIGYVLQAPDEPLLALVGDYNAGKSSLLKRLLVEHGRPVPPDLVIGGRPTTDQSRPHDLGGIRLVDTPGFQSGVKSHENEAFVTAAEASALLLVFHPNLVIGDTRHLDSLLGGTQLTLPRLGQVFAVINRSDELGVDPTESPEEYARLCRRKRIELQQALASRGFELGMDRIICVSADPFGLVGDSREVSIDDYRANSSWDRVGRLESGLRLLAGPAAEPARLVSLVTAGYRRLRLREQECHDLVGQSQGRAAELERLTKILERAKGDAKVLRRDIAHRAEATIRAHAQVPYDELLAALDDKMIAARIEAFEHWYEGPLLEGELNDWALDAEERINAWTRATSSDVLREFRGSSFQGAFTEVPSVSLDGLSVDRSGTQGMRLAYEGLNHLVKAFSKRDNVYKVGKAIGYKFKPWEAGGKAKTIGKAAPWLAGLGVVLEGVDWHMSLQAERKRESARRAADDFFVASVQAITDCLLSSDNVESPVVHLDSQVEEIDRVLAEIADEQRILAGNLMGFEFEISCIREFAEEGLRLVHSEDQRRYPS